jgi:thiol-disulfide isomerase/thioredoxin
MAPHETPVSLASLTFENPEGEPVTLGELSGKTLLVNLWATWCAPCREEMPALDALQQEAGGEDFAVVTINLDTGAEDKPREFLEEIGVDNLPLYRDASMDVFNELKSEGLAFGLPVTLLVDENSCLMAAMNGPADWASEDALRLVETAKEI